MKKMFHIFMGVLLCASISAQSLPCDSALVFPNSDTCITQSLSSDTEWYKVIASATDFAIRLENLNATVSHIHRLDFYSGTCPGSLILLDSVEVSGTNDTILMLNETGLNIGSTYFIKLTKTKPSCPRCNNTSARYRLCLLDVLGVRPCLLFNTQPACCIPHACIDASTVACNYTVCAGEMTTFCYSNTELGATFPSNYLTMEYNGSDIGTQTVNSSTPGAGGIMCFNPTWSTPGTYILDMYYWAPTNDCSNIYHWIITMTVLAPPSITSFGPVSPPPYCYNAFPLCFNTSATGTGNLYTYTTPYETSGTTTSSAFCATTLNPPGDNVTVSILNECGTVSSSIFIPIHTLKALFSWVAGCPGQPTTFTDLSICVSTPATYLWNFGDGATSTLQNPTHIYASAGSYNVTLTVTDASGSSSINYFVNITNAILPIISPTSLIACEGSPTTITILNYDPANTYSIAVFPLGAGTSTSVNSSGQFTVTWISSGSGLVVLGVTDSKGCINSLDISVKECCSQFPPGVVFNNADVSDIIALGPLYYSIVGTTILVSNKTLSINGIFHVNQNLHFNLCTITLGQDAQIIVDPPFTFAGTKSRFSACNFMWDGIYADNITSTVRLRDCLVEDAKNAVILSNGARHFLLGNLFNKNYESIIVKDFSGLYPINSVQSNVFTCRNYTGVPHLTIFPYITNYASYPTTTMNAPYTGQRSKTGCVFSLLTNASNHYQTSDNIFDFLNTGVYSSKSNLKLFSNTFKNIITVSSGTAIAAINAVGRVGTIIPFTPNFNLTVGGSLPVQANTFQTCLVGVNTTLNMNVNVINNDFNFITNYAVHCENSTFFNGINIKENTILNATVGVLCRGNTFCNTQIAENKMNITSTFFFPAATGVWLQELSSSGTTADYTIYNNKIQNVKYGVRASGLNNANIDNNKIETRSIANARGIEVLANSLTQIVSNQIKSIPGTGILDRGGIYVSMSPQSNIACNVIQDYGYSIQCAGPMTSTSVFNNTFANATRGIWLSNGGLIGFQGNSTSPSYNKWLGSFTDHTKTSGPATTSGPLSKFFVRTIPAYYVPTVNTGETSSGSTFITTSPASGPIASPSCTYVPPPALLLGQQIAQDQLAFTNQEIRWLSKHSLYKELLADSTLLIDPVLDSFNDSIELSSMGKLNRVKKALSKKHLTASELLIAINENASVFPTSPIETESKTINEILLQNLQNNQEVFDISQLTTLRIIANECPFEYGDAVYSARVLLQPYDSIGTEYLEPCLENRSMIATSETNLIEQGFDLYPNPNKGIMTLSYQLNESDKGELSIYDLAGRKLKIYSLNSESKALTIQENELSNGVYLYEVTINDKKVKTDRVVILK